MFDDRVLSFGLYVDKELGKRDKRGRLPDPKKVLDRVLRDAVGPSRPTTLAEGLAALGALSS